jgi:XTP/dITP diphosphohydrolase
MSRLVIGTNNVHKTREIKQILAGFYDEILSLEEAGIELEVDEDGETLEENAVKKAVEAAKRSGCDTLADDTGLMVDALGGAPGVYSARYAGEDVSYEQNNIKLLKELDGSSDRNAKFVCVMALVKEGKVITAKGEVPGVITKELLGEQGFGYDPLFYSTELCKTFAQASAEEKNAVSHRARALTALKKKLEREQD